MPLVELWVNITALAILIALSGFFSGLEVALVGTRISQVRQLVKQNAKGSHALNKLKSNPGRMMSSVNLGNNLVNVGSSALATSVAIELFGNDGLAIAVGIMTFLILVFGEITPKTYCNANATKVALRFSPVLLAFSYVFWPIVLLFEMITKFMVKITGSSYHAPPITEEEIKGIVEQGLVDKALEKDEKEMVHGALEFDDTVVKSVMTPRIKMFSLSSRMILFDALPLINKNSHSRIPIYGDSQDDIVGFVHVRDVLLELEKDNKMITLKEIARDPVFVSQEKMVSSLLKEMQGRKTHMAIVVDEHGGVEGLVTLEDLLEEIVGEIEDETDVTKPKEYHILDNNTIITNGDIEIFKLNEIFKVDIPEGDDYRTLNGLLHEKLQDIPQEGDKLEIANLKIIVEKTKKNFPEKIRIEHMKK
jgi:CBS domain containing-hemolysin-like protein